MTQRNRINRAVVDARISTCSMALVLLAAVSLLVCSNVSAEARRDGGDDAMRRMQYMLRELTTENQALKTDNAKLQGDLEKLKGDNTRLSADLDANKSALNRNRHNNEMLVDRVKSDNEKFRTLVQQYREKLNELRMTQNKVAYLVQAVKERNDWIDTCKASNKDLYQANSKLLDLYQHRGMLDVLAGADPVTGLARVRKERMVEDYRYKLEDLKMLDFAGSTTPVTADNTENTTTTSTPH